MLFLLLLTQEKIGTIVCDGNPVDADQVVTRADAFLIALGILSHQGFHDTMRVILICENKRETAHLVFHDYFRDFVVRKEYQAPLAGIDNQGEVL